MERKIVVEIETEDTSYCLEGKLAFYSLKCPFLSGNTCQIFGQLSRDGRGKVLRHSKCILNELKISIDSDE